MKPEVRLSSAAFEDLEAIALYTAERFGTKQSLSYRDGLLAAFELLAENPRLGSDQSHVKSGTRRLVHESHRIYYRVREDGVFVLRILGPGQDPTHHFS